MLLKEAQINSHYGGNMRYYWYIFAVAISTSCTSAHKKTDTKFIESRVHSIPISGTYYQYKKDTVTKKCWFSWYDPHHGSALLDDPDCKFFGRARLAAKKGNQ